MNDYFLNLFKYDRDCNRLILQIIADASQPSKPVQLMAHVAAAQQIWLNRCKGIDNAANPPIWPNWQMNVFENLLEENHDNWTDFLKDADINAVIKYNNSKGEPFKNTLGQITTHVINHGTHHRAQAGQHLKLAGINALPLTDYILWARN